MMNRHDGGGNADKKEKTTLLREITYLTRLLQQHDCKNKQPASRLDDSLMKSQLPANKCLNFHSLNPSTASYGGTIQMNKSNCSNVQTSSPHGIEKMSLPASRSVFVNPKKLNCQLLETNQATDKIQKQSSNAEVDIQHIPHKVYINPNFKKKESPSNKSDFKYVAMDAANHNAPGTVNTNFCINRESKFRNGNIVSQNVKKVLPANYDNRNIDAYKIQKSQKAVSYCNPGQVNKILLNKKHFISSSCLMSISRDSKVNIVDQKVQNLARKVMSHNSEPKIVPEFKNTDVFQVYDNSKSSCGHPVELKSRTVISAEKTPDVPRTGSAVLECHRTVHSSQESCKTSGVVIGKDIVSKTCKQKLNVNSAERSSSYHVSLPPQKICGMVCHRRRSSSTCLVAVSKTKLVRKRKVDMNGTDTENIKNIPIQKKKLIKKSHPVNRDKLNKIGTIKIKSVTPKTNFVYSNPFRFVKYKPGIRALSLKANSSNKDKFRLVRYKPSGSSSGPNKLKLVVAQKNVKQAHCSAENIKLLQSKIPNKSKGKNVTIKSRYFIIKRGLENASGIQGNKQVIQLRKDVRNKCFSHVRPGNALFLAKKTKLVRANKLKIETNNKTRSTPSGSALLAVSRTKLVRKPIAEIKRIQKLKTAEYKHETKLTPSMKMAHRVKNKYKFIRNQLNSNVNVAGHPEQPQVLQETPRISSTVKNRMESRVLKKRCSLIKIGDVYYRASHNKLTRKTPYKGAGSCGSIFKIQGKKYALQRGRQSLKYFRIKPFQVLKIKSGSGNYVHPKIGTSNTNRTWSRLVQAKQKSIALLTNRLRKNNQPCLMFNRFGRCAGKDKGTCNKLHDPKNISICKRFVQGCCENINCLLSHKVGPEKMPTCHHFLAGNCVRENCPYLHVKLSKKAPICLAFLQGYCADAANCQKRHEHICPEFEEKGLCSKGKYCPYPHPRMKSKRCKRKNSVEAVEEETKNVVSSCRYFEDATANPLMSTEVSEESVSDESIVCISDEESSDCWLNKRPKIGDLPGYIPLMNRSVDKNT